MRYRVKRIRCRYWRPGEDYVKCIVEAVRRVVREGDVVVVSEKALATAKGRVVDEEGLKPGLLAILLARWWMRIVWGYLLGPLCHLKGRSVERLRRYPVEEGARHKQLALLHAGLLQALRHGSEGGIDVTNLPYSYACLPLEEPEGEAEYLSRRILEETGRRVVVVIADTDMTYTWRRLHFTPRPRAIRGIIAKGGVLVYVLCRALKLKPRATPLALAGGVLGVEEALQVAELAHHARGSGVGRTVWDAAEAFGTSLTGITWEMLEGVKHYPIVIVRPM